MLAATAAAEMRRFPPTAEAIAKMDSWIENVGERWGLDGRMVFRARICASELACNAMEHGQMASDSDGIVVELRHKPPGLEIEFSDAGSVFDPVAAPAVKFDNEHTGGRGLHLVRSYSHALSYRRNRDRNVVTLQFVPVAG